MTLLITVFAAVICTAIWYRSEEMRELKFGILCWMFWGASLMWFVDAVFEFIELKAEYFKPEFSDMVNDAFLGLSVVALGLVIWIAVLLIKDPKGVIKSKLFKK